jgi:hypothetical protein
MNAAALDAEAVRRTLHEALVHHRRGADALAHVLSEASSLPDERLRDMAQAILELEPAWDEHPAIRAFVEKAGCRPSPSRPETLALRILQDLSRYHVPYAPPLGNAEAVAAFGDRLDRVLETLVESAASLRFAYLSETEPDPPRERRERDLAAHLLDWTADRSAIDELAAQLALIVGHHRRLVVEALTGVDRALASLRPSAIEAATPWSLFRYRKLWLEFQKRYADAVRRRPSGLGRALTSASRALGLLYATPAPVTPQFANA